MRLDYLSLKGLLRFTGQVTVDVRDVAAGLIAITGENGAGKTTILEAPFAALYRSFASRTDALVDYAQDRESHIEIGFSLDGRGTFIARLNLDHVSRQSSAVVSLVHPHGLAQELNDGKVSTYDQAVASLLPAPALMLASVVAAQNRRGSFLTLDRKARKDLFAQLLGLEHYERLAETARGAAVLVEAARTRAGAMADVLARETAPIIGRALDERAANLRLVIGSSRHRVSELEDNLDQVATERARLEHELQAYHAALVEQRLAEDRRREVEAEHERVSAALREHLAAWPTTAQTMTARHEGARRDLDTRLTNNRGLLSEADAIRAAVAEVARCDAALATLHEHLTQAERVMALAREALQSEERILDTDRAAKREAERDLARIDRDTATLTTVPCHGEGQYAGCQFLQQALVAFERRADVARAATRPLDESRLTAAAAHLETVSVIPPVLRAQQDPLRRARAAADLLAKKAIPLAQAEARVAELEQRLAALAADQARELTEAKARHVEIDRAHRDALQALQDRRRVVQVTADAAQSRVARTHGAVTQAQTLDAALTSTRWHLDEARRTLAVAESQLLEFEQQQARYRAQCDERDRVQRWRRRLDDEQQGWRLLATALGRDGLPVLEIDGAGPTVSSYVNDLLTACFGSRFSVELVTQEAKAGGKGTKESFAILVYDNARGGDPRDLVDLSGGEQIILDEAIKAALAIYLNTRSPHPLQTCWRDETTGPLDPENAQRYVAMLRRLRELAGFHHLFFVTHNADAAAQADAQIRVADGGAALVFPPYAAAA